MNIFVLDDNLKLCAQYHCDKHVIKMIIEYTQMLSTTVRLHSYDAGYKITFPNHPCSVWARQSLSNFLWLKQLIIYLNEEYKLRYKNCNHKSYETTMSLPLPSDLKDIGLTKFPLLVPDNCKIKDDPVSSYRNLYNVYKTKIATWRNREIPYWFKPTQ